MYIRDKTSRKSDGIVKSIPRNYSGSMYNFNSENIEKSDGINISEGLSENLENTDTGIKTEEIPSLENMSDQSNTECIANAKKDEKCSIKEDCSDKKSISKALGNMLSKGINSEDLLILGIIALIIFNEGDNEIIILLALLYLSGILPW